MKVLQNLILATSITVLIVSCGNVERAGVSVPIEPTEELIEALNGTEFSIVLNDMNIDEQNGKDLFQHKYHVLKVIKDALIVDSLDWQTVNKDFFLKHENDLGMEIVSNHNNKLSRVAKPVGFDWAVGNEKHGQWEVETDSTKTGTGPQRSYWRPHTSSGLFWYWMLSRRTYQSHYAGHRAYSNTGKTYYGKTQNGGTTYGTNSAYEKTKRSNFFTRRNTSATYKSFTARKSASSSRYKGASSTRSKSGGFGK